jgi:peroxiredoxin
MDEKHKPWVIAIVLVIGILVGGAAVWWYATSQRPQPSQMSKSMHSRALPQEGIELKDYYGKNAPDFSLQGMNGMMSLSDYKGKTVVLFFNEGSMCYPSCWRQMAQLASDARFNNDDVLSFSIVVDPKQEWEKIMANVPQMRGSQILFDTDRKVSSAYGVMGMESSMHKGSYPGHTFFIIDKEGKIRYAMDDPMMAVRNEQLAAQLAAIV